MGAKLSVKIDNVGAVSAALQQVAKSRILVGIPEADGPRKRDVMNNATLLYIHTNGSPINHIPARPVLEAALSYQPNRDQWTAEMAATASAALDGSATVVNQGLDRTAILAQNIAKEWFTNPANNWAENSPATIARKGSDSPLIDTGQLRNAIVGLVDKNGAS